MTRRGSPRLQGCLLLLAALLLAVGGTQAASAGASAKRGLARGQLPPPVHASDLDGKPQSLDQYIGKVVVLHFWATWCPYCRMEIPKLKRVHQEMADKGVVVLAVSMDEDTDKLLQFVAASEIPYPVIADAKQNFTLAESYQIFGIPVTYVIGRDGHLLGRTQDVLAAAELAAALKPGDDGESSD